MLGQPLSLMEQLAGVDCFGRLLGPLAVVAGAAGRGGLLCRLLGALLSLLGPLLPLLGPLAGADCQGRCRGARCRGLLLGPLLSLLGPLAGADC